MMFQSREELLIPLNLDPTLQVLVCSVASLASSPFFREGKPFDNHNVKVACEESDIHARDGFKEPGEVAMPDIE
jgi:hypothetical protein